ncbi:MAG: ACP S-malonyltransferase [Oscillatoriales cyanobacterium RU_3_3]|nr:ACP S-malonyltransferase [Microcoleus sp. SU_5_6]NJM61831.1 ACP S-malonyltransferase [Oscillatoriales cyanobacterium RU_3_3]NJR25280.1 ACP S-malonyltransferase [Richelia sp. CSU_2_1]
MIVLVDYNINRQALLLAGRLTAGGWLEIAPIRLVTFRDIGLPENSNDRVVWKFAQANGMPLLTANRNAKGEDSLEEVMREESSITSFPIITISNAERLNEYEYRDRCVEKLVEIALDLPDFMGCGRLFIP